MNELMIFDNEMFGEIRFVEVDGKPYAIASDVARALGYAIPSKAVNTHCKGVSKMEVPTNGGKQDMLIIPEGDIYRLIIKSKLPSAEKFETWVMDEVLPTIRKTGFYSLSNTNNLPMEVNQLLDCIDKQQQQIDNLLNSTKEQQGQIDEIKQLVGIRAKQTFNYSQLIKNHLGIEIINEDYRIIKEMFFVEMKISKWEDLSFEVANVKRLKEICNEYKPPNQISWFD